MNQPDVEASPTLSENTTSKNENTKDKTRARIGYLDTYRGIACLMVYFYHTAVNLPLFGVTFPGYYGVHLFFVLSGYLMVSKFIPVLQSGGEMPDLRKYLTRRFLRIYPPYLVCLLVFVGLRSVGNVNPIEWQNILLHAALIFNYVDRYDYFSISAVYWSLAVEIQFYLVLPLAVWLSLRFFKPGDKRVLWFALSFIAVGILSRALESAYINHDHPDAIAHIRFKWVTSHLDLFGFGILLRIVEWKARARQFHLSPKKALAFVALAFAIFYVVALWSHDNGGWQESKDFWFVVLGSPLACIGFACLLATTSLSSLKESPIFTWRLPQWVGTISYSFYLYHVGVLFVFNRFFHPLSWGLSWSVATLLTGLVCLLPSLLVAWVAYHLIEKPFLKMG